MITTLLPILESCSRKLKESMTDVSTLRVGYGNDSCRNLLSLFKFGWSKKKYDLVISVGTQEYDLTSVLTDYSPIRGIYEVYVGGDKIDSLPYNNIDSVSGSTSQYFYLKPDDKTIGFTLTLDGTEDIEIWYYAEWVNATSSATTLNISIPDSFTEALALYMKYLVHDGRRQRYDARNALLDFRQQIDTLIPQQGSSKIKDQPRRVFNFFSYLGFKRTYKV